MNPLVPVGYGAVALIVAVLVHEGCAAVRAYANGMRLKSSGIILAAGKVLHEERVRATLPTF